MDILAELILQNGETPITILLMWVLFQAYKWLRQIITQSNVNASKAFDAVAQSDTRSDEVNLNLSGAIQTIAQSSQISAQVQKEGAKYQKVQNQLLNKLGNVLVDIKGDTSATRTSQYSMERELSGIRADLGRIEKKLNRIGSLVHSNNKIIQLKNDKRKLA